MQNSVCFVGNRGCCARFPTLVDLHVAVRIGRGFDAPAGSIEDETEVGSEGHRAPVPAG